MHVNLINRELLYHQLCWQPWAQAPFEIPW